MMAYAIKLQTFEGPLDLLLHLIEKAEVDIYDIPIAEITDQYLQYLYQMQEFKIDIASEFLVMAATLLAIKSKMLLPKHEDLLGDKSEEDSYVDPREELVQRLLEYKRFKIVSETLKELEFARNQVFTRPPEDFQQYLSDLSDVNPSYNVSILQLFISFQMIMQKYKEKNRITTITREEISVADKIAEIEMKLMMSVKPVLFQDLFSSKFSKTEVVVTFLAILELMKQKKILIQQTSHFGDITITALR